MVTKDEYQQAKKILSEAYMYGEPSGECGRDAYESELQHAREIIEEYKIMELLNES